MHNHYIINESVEFHPATSKLRDINNPDSVVTLNSPAGRCLLLLINRMGNVVTQKEFMEIVWKQNGMMVTSNAYYQNISVLRKGLKRVGLDESFIVTLPRIGLTLASGTNIRKLAEETSIEISTDDTALPVMENDNIDSVHNEIKFDELSERCEPNELPEVYELNDRPSLVKNHHFIKRESSKKIRYGVVFMMVLLVHDFALFLCFKG